MYAEGVAYRIGSVRTDEVAVHLYDKRDWALPLWEVIGTVGPGGQPALAQYVPLVREPTFALSTRDQANSGQQWELTWLGTPWLDSCPRP